MRQNLRRHPASACTGQGKYDLSKSQLWTTTISKQQGIDLPCPVGPNPRGPAISSSGAFSRRTKNTVRPTASTVKRKVLSWSLRNRKRPPSVLVQPNKSTFSVSKRGCCVRTALTAGSMGWLGWRAELGSLKYFPESCGSCVASVRGFHNAGIPLENGQ